MLHWLRKGLELPKTPFQRIVYVCVAVHLLLFFVCCFIQHDDHMHVMVQGASAARIVCVPSFMLPRAVKNNVRSARTKKRQPQKAKKKVVKKRTPVAEKKPTTLQKAVQEKTKKQKKVVPKKIPEPEIAEILEEPEEIIIEPEITPEAEHDLSAHAEDDVIYVNRDTYQMLEVAKALQEAIGTQWAPPAGMPAQTSCLIRVTIDAQGTATGLEVVQKSGIAVFDMAARKAVLAADYPPHVWGKTMVVHFNEEFA